MTVAGCTIVRASAHFDQTCEQNPECPVDWDESRTLHRSAEDRDLTPECEVLGDEALLRSEGRTKRAEDGHEEGEHGWTFVDGGEIVSGESVQGVG
jgi:hypothetical protein